MGALLLQVLPTLVIGIVGELMRRYVKGSDRRAQILGIADRVFDVIEVLGKINGWDSAAKWTNFASQITDALREQGLGQLSGQEMAMLKRLAADRAISAKKLPPPLPHAR